MRSAVKFSLPLPTQITLLRPVPELEKVPPFSYYLPVTLDYSGDCKQHNKILSTNTFPLYFLGYSPDDGDSLAALGLCPVISDTANTSKNCGHYETATFILIPISVVLVIILLTVYCRFRKMSKENAETQPIVTAKSVSPERT